MKDRGRTRSSPLGKPAKPRRQAGAPGRAQSPRGQWDLINSHLVELIHHANDGIVLTDLTGRILYVNPAFETMNGYTSGELLNRHPEELIVADDPKALGDLIRDTVRAQGEWTGDLVCRRRDGETYPIQSRVFAIRDAQGEIIEIAAIQHDITERKRAEKALRESEEKLRTQYKSMPVPTYTWQRRGDDFVLVDYNDAADAITRGKVREYLGRNAGDIYREKPEILENLRRCYAGKTTVVHEMPYLLEKTGELKHLDVKYVFVPPDLILAHTEDITERKRAEISLLRYALIYHSMGEALIICTCEGVIVDINSAAETMFGWTREELAGRAAEMLNPPELAKEISADINAALRQKREWRGEIPLVTKSGAQRILSTVVSCLRDNSGKLIGTIGINRDITEQKRVEKELRKSEKRFRSLFEDSPISLWEEDFSDIARHFRALREKGVKNFRKHFDDTPGDVEKCAAMLRIVDVNRATIELYEAGDQRRFLPYLSSGFHEGTFELFKEELIALAEGRAVFERETVTETLTGKKKYISLRLSVTPGYEETLSRVYISIVDLTERKRLEEQLLHSQKMEAIGTLAGGIAHDFNNILAGIIGYVNLLKGALSRESPLLADMESIEKLSWRCADLTKSLLAFSRKSPYHPVPLDINTLVREALTLVGQTLGRTISIQTELAEGVLNAYADRGQLHQVVMNLYINACEAMSEGGTLTVKTENAKPESSFFALHRALKRGPYIVLTISDTGIGMDAGTRARMFEPFFTTKAERSGTGLGLSVVSGIVERHGGCIEVESAPRAGTTITVYLPATEEKERETPLRRVETLRGDETLMLVDDEESFRAGTARWLRELGYTVLEAPGGEEALEALRNNRDRVRLVLLDMIMKGMGGAQTFAAMRGIVPDLAVIICTGYAVNSSCQQLIEEGARCAIPKPFDHNELALKIREILDR